MPFSKFRDARILALLALMVVQVFCAVFFLVDISRDIAEDRYSVRHVALELMANGTLVVAIVMEGMFFLHLLRRQAMADRTISAASGALDEVIQDYYRQWALTPAEADVATFTIKGFSIAEVARMRGSAEGTIKNHLNAIYRKAGLSGRSQLVSLLIEDLLDGRIRDATSGRKPYPRDGERTDYSGTAGVVAGD